MRSHLTATVALLAAIAQAKDWAFQDGSVSVSSKGAGVGAGSKEKLSTSSRVSTALALGSGDTLKVALTAVEDGTPSRPHQAFLTLQDPATGAEDAYPINIKDAGKGKLELTHKDLPAQFAAASNLLRANILLASFGSSKPFEHHAFDLSITQDAGASTQKPERPTRYGKLDEIHHIFRLGPKSPPTIITLFFVAAGLVTIPMLFGVWALLGANLNHLPEALGNAPLSHAAFFGSILALEGIFFLYYSHWRLYQMLPAASAVGLMAFLSGSRALSEVQSRRLGGKR